MRHTARLAVLLLLATAISAADPLHVSPFARDLGEERTVLALGDGTILVSRPKMFDVIALRDGDGRADEVRTAVASVAGAHGLAMRNGTLYVAGTRQIVAAERLPDGSFSVPREVVGDLPDGGGDRHRALTLGPDGAIYVSIPEHGTLLRFDPDGGNRRILARGLRDLRGLAWHPDSGELWGADGAELNRIGDGLNFDTEPPAASDAPAALCFSGNAAYGVRGHDVVRMPFDGGRPSPAERLVSIDGAELAGFAATADALFVSDARGAVYRLTETPTSMTSSGGQPASMTILAKAFALDGLRGAGAVVHDEEQDVYFVSGTGFIARVSPDGKLLDREFAAGVQSPRGMAIDGAELWVADGTNVRVFERLTGRSVRTIDLASHGAVFLNHVATGADGAIYVTDTDVHVKGSSERVRAGDGRIFRIEKDGDVEIAIHGEELRSPAGIAWDGTRFLVAQAYGSEIVAWQPGHHAKAVFRGPGAFEGLAILPNGAVIVTSRNDDGVHVGMHEGVAGELKPLFARAPAPGGIAFDKKRNRLLIPSPQGGWLESWTLPPMSAVQPSDSKIAQRLALLEAAPPDTSSTSR